MVAAGAESAQGGAGIWRLEKRPVRVRFEAFGTTIFLFGADLVNMVIALLLFGGIVAFVRYTKGGVAIRATAEKLRTRSRRALKVPGRKSRPSLTWATSIICSATSGS